ncbi:aldo/keto reductase [Nguyenibacter vanlangensis]|uniref:Aldo/keto reductase n=1 Tax=Nguyenibacter vanlangensis TaxID=1216886 RepID=A0ABZ3D3J2_9PROT
MQFRKLGGTGLQVSRLCIGTGTFGKQTDEAEAFRVLDAAADAGVNFIDTADIYPGVMELAEVGRAEEITGRWLKDRRGQFIIGTKAGWPMGPFPWDQGCSRKHLLSAIDESLRRLNTDYIDLYQLHRDDADTPLDETVEALDIIVRSGKARYIGVSNFLAYRLARAIGRQDMLRLARFVSVQPRYNLLTRDIERELLPLAKEENIAVIPFNPLAGGLLTGKYKRDDNPEQGRFSAEVGRFGAMYRDRYWHQREFDTIDELRSLADGQNTSMPTMAIAWILANPTITSVILGASRTAQLTDTLAAVDYDLSPNLKAEFDALTEAYR